MIVTNKTSELAAIIFHQFEDSRLKAEAINPELGRHKFTIGTTAPNLIAIQVPEVIQIDHYADSIFNIVISIIDEAGYQVTEPIEVHIYGPGKEPVADRTIYPTSKKYVN
ncbi:MAG TPA: hypothetical protein VF679_02595 [Pedobacter sp.]|jgi:hypothetical protein